MVQFIWVIILMVLTEGTCTLYLIFTEKRKPLLSAIFCSLTVLFTSLTIINYVNNYILILAALIGSFIGSYLVVTFTKK